MEALFEHIDNQIEFNKGKNLFHRNRKDLFEFTAETKNMIKQITNIDKKSENRLLEYLTTKALEEFFRINQYYSFDVVAKQKLRAIYTDLVDSFKENRDLHEISENHFTRLKNWLSETNHFSEEIYTKENEKLDGIVCAEYSPLLQIKLLGIDLSSIVEPVLDIGCGKAGALVSFLRNQGIGAFGFDRIKTETMYCSDSDWFEYDFGVQKWGTIISNLGFSNHFKHHHLRVDGNYIEYAQKYMEILHALKIGGSFYYAPGLPFIETYLDSKEFNVTTHQVGDTDYLATKIGRKNNKNLPAK